jgi:hypothetical protein
MSTLFLLLFNFSYGMHSKKPSFVSNSYPPAKKFCPRGCSCIACLEDVQNILENLHLQLDPLMRITKQFNNNSEVSTSENPSIILRQLAIAETISKKLLALQKPADQLHQLSIHKDKIDTDEILSYDDSIALEMQKSLEVQKLVEKSDITR